jgi:hypothetical protein
VVPRHHSFTEPLSVSQGLPLAYTIGNALCSLIYIAHTTLLHIPCFGNGRVGQHSCESDMDGLWIVSFLLSIVVVTQQEADANGTKLSLKTQLTDQRLRPYSDSKPF